MKRLFSFLLAGMLALCCCVTVSAQDLPIIPIGPQVKINGLSLVLDGEIGLVYHIEVPEVYRTGYAVLTCKGNDNPVQVNIADCPTDAQGKYTVTYNLTAVQLSEPVTVTVYSQSGAQLATKSKSASEYAALMIADANSTEKEIAVAKGLINYGHYAQLACAEYCGWTVGTDYAETAAYAAPSVTAAVFDAYKPEWEGTPLSGMTLQLSLDYKTDFVLYLPGSETAPTVTVNGEAPDRLEKDGDGRYKLYIEGINCMCLGDTYTITVNGVSSFTVSAFSYGYLAMSGTTENTRQALLSMYEFYQAICDYHS